MKSIHQTNIAFEQIHSNTSATIQHNTTLLGASLQQELNFLLSICMNASSHTSKEALKQHTQKYNPLLQTQHLFKTGGEFFLLSSLHMLSRHQKRKKTRLTS